MFGVIDVMNAINAYQGSIAGGYAGMQNAQQNAWQETPKQREARSKAFVDETFRIAKLSKEEREREDAARIQRELDRIEADRRRIHAQLMTRILDKDTNMSTRLERRRKALREKWEIRGKVITVSMVVTPLAIALLAMLWRLAFWTILS